MHTYRVVLRKTGLFTIMPLRGRLFSEVELNHFCDTLNNADINARISANYVELIETNDASEIEISDKIELILPKKTLKRNGNKDSGLSLQEVANKCINDNPIAAEWIYSVFGDVLSIIDKMELIKFVTGNTGKFYGKTNFKWQTGLTKIHAGISHPMFGTKIKFDKIREEFIKASCELKKCA